jgi:hypothetical protein
MNVVEAYKEQGKIVVKYSKPANNGSVALFSKAYAEGDEGYAEAQKLLNEGQQNV